MIIFYNKKTGKINGTISGRIHNEVQLGMWIGDKDKIGRIVVAWSPVKHYDKDGNVTEKAEDFFTADYKPDHKQADIFIEIEKGKRNIKDYKVNTKTLDFISNDTV